MGAVEEGVKLRSLTKAIFSRFLSVIINLPKTLMTLEEDMVAIIGLIKEGYRRPASRHCFKVTVPSAPSTLVMPITMIRSSCSFSLRTTASAL